LAVVGRYNAARQHGIDLTLLIEQLRLTPAERVRRMELAAQAAQQIQGAALISRDDEINILRELESLLEAQEPE
jgi:hypothetical protein